MWVEVAHILQVFEEIVEQLVTITAIQGEELDRVFVQGVVVVEVLVHFGL